MLYYILQIIAFQLVFLLIYDLFLKKETFFNWNRIYLIGTAILSFVLPFLKFESIKAMAPENFVIRLPEVIIGEVTPTQLSMDLALQAGITTQQPTTPIWEMVFWVGLCVASLVFAFKLVKLYWLKSKSPKRWKGNVLLVKLLNSSSAFSFFNTIFMGERIASSEQSTVLKHELVHVEQKHTLDLLFFETLRIAMWFNPLVYMYQNRVKTLHEYIADAIAVKEHGKRSYYQSLLNQVFETQHLSFTNTFYKSSLIKKRIAMLQKSKSNQRNLLKYTLLIPMVFGMLIYTSADVKAQVKEGKVETIHETILINDIQLNYEELEEKYYQELIKKVAQGFNIFENYREYLPNEHNYRSSMKEYAKTNAYLRYMAKEGEKRGNKRFSQFMEEKKSYEEYLEWLETDEAKQRWESNSKDGVQRLFVENFSNKTKEEQARFDKKLKMLQEDEYWHTLIVTDGKFRAEFTPDANENKDNNYSGNGDVVVEEVSESIEVPFSVIENPPTFKECEDKESAEEKRNCMSNGIAKFVNRNFNTDLAKDIGLSGRQRISVFFKVGKDGNISSIAARAPHPDLEEEAKRVIGLLPQMVPGTQRGRAVTVPYSLPILFQVNDESKEEPINHENKKEFQKFMDAIDAKGIANGVVPFFMVDKAPVAESCRDIKDEEDRKICTSNSVSQFVNKNFNLDLASKLGLEGRQRILVAFTINEHGKVTDVVAKSNNTELENEAVRSVSALPQFVPGEHKGKTVAVSYKLPIIFQVASNTKKDKN